MKYKELIWVFPFSEPQGHKAVCFWPRCMDPMHTPPGMVWDMGMVTQAVTPSLMMNCGQTVPGPQEMLPALTFWIASWRGNLCLTSNNLSTKMLVEYLLSKNVLQKKKTKFLDIFCITEFVERNQQTIDLSHRFPKFK